eukprot:jgi/Botrbrau1/1667/Bobra.116_2s0011.1
MYVMYVFVLDDLYRDACHVGLYRPRVDPIARLSGGSPSDFGWAKGFKLNESCSFGC